MLKQFDHVSRHNVFNGDLNDSPIAPHIRLDADKREQRSHDFRGAVLLPESQEAAQGDDCENDQRIGAVCQKQGKQGGGEEDNDDRIAELSNQ